MIRVLFVCYGNLCRSPIAAGLFGQLLDAQGWTAAIAVDAAGTHAWQLGKPPDARACEAAARYGVDIADQRVRDLDVADFEDFDYIVAMDSSNLEHLAAMAPPGHRTRLLRLMELAPEAGVVDVPDPYYGDRRGFDTVVSLAEQGARGLLAYIVREHGERLRAGAS